MTIPIHRRNRRLIQLVGLLKTGRVMSAPSYCKWLRSKGFDSVCPKTIQRDVRYLQNEMGALVDYDPVKKGYVLYDNDWSFPHAALEGDELFAAVLGESIVRNIIPQPLSSSLDSAMRVQLAAGDPKGIDPQLLSSVAIATSSKLAADAAAVFDTVCRAWRKTRRLQIDYASADADSYSTRQVDVHALFMADGAWYARVFCHLRQDHRSLALHRIRKPKMLADKFARSEKIVAEIQSGHVFDYEMIKDVTVICDPVKASVIREREWFPGQKIETKPDGKLKLTIPQAPRPMLIRWILSYAGHLTATTPPDIVEEIHAAAQKISTNHQPAREKYKKIAARTRNVPHPRGRVENMKRKSPIQDSET